MDKNEIKKFAVWARRELIARVSQKAVQYGIEENSMVDGSAAAIGEKLLSNEEIKQRQALIAQIKEKGYPQVMEEVAYTWFNRFIALRFMEVNNYLPSHVRVFTDEEDNFKPQIITEAIHMELDGLDMEKVYALKEANQTEELYRYLLITQCNALNQILPKMFQKISDYTELLFPDNLLREGSVLQQMIEMIPEEDWQDTVQIIGWLYQYYNAEKKDEVFAALKKNVKITKENIPAATQLFTPDWIVRYMVENSLGRLWLEHLTATGEGYHYSYGADGECNAAAYVNADKISALKGNWKYYLDEAPQEPEVQAQLAVIRKEYAAMTPEQIKCIDPCCGSGHILAYLFDVLVQIYESYGYTTREAVESIVKNNLYGLDIDDRAAQLAYFAVMMKARQYDRRFFSRNIQPHVYAIQDCKPMPAESWGYLGEEEKIACGLWESFTDAKEYGSLVKPEVTLGQLDQLKARLVQMKEIAEHSDLFAQIALDVLCPLIELAQVLVQKYDVVVTNPPYMGSSGMGAKLVDFVKMNYPDSKSDLFAVFIEACGSMTRKNGFQAMITQHAWMFLSSFEKLRTKLLQKDTINMAHLGARAFDEIGGEVVQTTSFVLRNSHIADYKGTYCRLIEPTTQQGKEDMFLAGENGYTAQQSNFSKIPGSPVAYWVSDNLISTFNNNKIGDLSYPKQGLSSADNNRFLRLWFEVAFTNFNNSCVSNQESAKSGVKWFPFNKGGEYRKWYGNFDYVINWKNDGFELRNFPNAAIRNSEYYFLPHVTWSKVTSGTIAFRYRPIGSVFSDAGCAATFSDDIIWYALGLLNTKYAQKVFDLINPTLNYTQSTIAALPVMVENKAHVDGVVSNNMVLSQADWDSFETSWDFKIHPLVRLKDNMKFTATNGNRKTVSYFLQGAYRMWENECEQRFNQLKANEEELNRIFIEIYGLQDELTPEVEDKDVTVRKADLTRDIKSLISYAVGCMFGRYSLDRNGLVYAGGAFEDFYQRDSLATENGDVLILGDISLGVSESYTQVKVGDQWVDCRFPVDKDNIIPIYDDPDYSENDLPNQFVMWIRTVYGKDTLDENLKFIADALGGKGQPREVIRNYFLNDFYADHCKIYQKRPIYWLFDSGKKNGFKALIYMHRYQPDTIARIRTDYVHEQQARYRTAIADLENRIANTSTSERVKLNKALTKLQDQDAELRSYEEKIHHLADQMIAIDLDDGVKVNYAKFQDVLAKIK